MARPLKIFMRGKSVSLLQDTLRRFGYTIDDQKGLFGTMTRDAVKSFQKQRGLKPSGQVDDELLVMLQHGQSSMPEVENNNNNNLQTVTQVADQKQLDALIRLLVRKGVIEKEEVDLEMEKVVPSSL